VTDIHPPTHPSTHPEPLLSRERWLTPVIPATQEAEVRSSVV
jgi:hypothetical protein